MRGLSFFLDILREVWLLVTEAAYQGQRWPRTLHRWKIPGKKHVLVISRN